ncbi:hypothetical protein NMG60_11024288 [Bertholletia excelsa]
MSNARRPYFFEGFNPASSSERLKIPSGFIKHMEGIASGTVTLTGPSGNSWHVELMQHNDNLFFHDGWAAFVQDHFIERGDALVFRYDSDLHFTVQVFDQSSCEKESAFSAKCSQVTGCYDKLMGRKRERVDGASPLDSTITKKMRESQVHSECIAKNQEEGWQCDEETSATETCQAAVNTPEKNVVSFAMPLQSRAPQAHLEATIQNGNTKESELGSSVRGCMLTLSASEAEELAQSFNSCYPNFTKTMKRFNVSGSYTLNIPYQFSMAHLPKCKVKIVLHNLKGESWTVNSIPTIKVHTSHTLCGGWMAFVRDNDINEGDVCIFELVGKCELRVYILRVGKARLLECHNGKSAVKGLANGHASTSRKISECLPKKIRGDARKVHSNQIISDKKSSHLEEIFTSRKYQEASDHKDKPNSRASKSNPFCSPLKYGGGSSANQNSTSLEEKQGSYIRGCMSIKSAPEEKRAAQSFVSSFPHFVRVMKKFNISGSYTLKIPYQFSMAHLPNCKTEIYLRNLRGRCWIVNSVPSTRVQTLHTFCGGWMAFVRDNDIQLGDICIFELIDKCEMRVHIFGVGKKGLDCLNGKAASNDFTLALQEA